MNQNTKSILFGYEATTFVYLHQEFFLTLMWCNDKRSMMYEVMLLWQWYDSSADSGFRERARARRKFNFWHVMRILCILSTGSNIYAKVGTNPSLLACLSHWTLQYCNFLINNRSILKLNQLKFNLHSIISEFRVVNGELGMPMTMVKQPTDP